MILGAWENQLWAGNLNGQSYDDATFEGGNVDESVVLLTLTVSGSDEMHGVQYDADTAFVLFTPSSVDERTQYDIATVILLFSPSGTDSYHTLDTATLYLYLTPSSVDILEHPCFAGEGFADINWTGSSNYRWESEAFERWEAYLHIGAGRC